MKFDRISVENDKKGPRAVWQVLRWWRPGVEKDLQGRLRIAGARHENLGESVAYGGGRLGALHIFEGYRLVSYINLPDLRVDKCESGSGSEVSFLLLPVLNGIFVRFQPGRYAT